MLQTVKFQCTFLNKMAHLCQLYMLKKKIQQIKPVEKLSGKKKYINIENFQVAFMS